MSNIKNLEMAAAISAYNNVIIQKTLFGLSQKVVYTPTGSRVRVRVFEYAPAEGEKMARLLSLPPEKIEAEMKTTGKPQSTDIGHYRLEACFSCDSQFCAIQLFRFGDFKYMPVTDTLFYEGSDAQIVTKLI